MVQVFIFRKSISGGHEYLMIRRAPEEPVYPDMWQMVTGYIEEGETAYEAARRELEEETGIRASYLWVVPYIASFYNARTDTVEKIPVFAAEADGETDVRLSHEHTEYAWLDYAGARGRLAFPGHIMGLDVLETFILAGSHASLFVRISFGD
jgi:dATP pyrophosphohydrolase